MAQSEKAFRNATPTQRIVEVFGHRVSKNDRFLKVIQVHPTDRYDRHSGSFDVPETLILKAILEHGMNPAEAEAIKLSGGFQNANYLVRDGARRQVFRFYSTGSNAAEREIGLLYVLRNHDVAAPRPGGIYEIDGKSVGVIEFVDGSLLQDQLSRRVLLPRHFGAIGRALAKIHRIEFDRCGFFGSHGRISEEFESFVILARQYMEKVLEDVPADRLPGAVRDRLHRLIRERWGLVEESEPMKCLVHCDFNPKNIIISPDFEVRAVLDWEFSLAGNGYIDIGNFFRFLFDYPDGAREAFIGGYQEVRGPAHPRWFEIARLLDLTNMCSFLERREDYQKTFRTARWVIDGTLEFFGY